MAYLSFMTGSGFQMKMYSYLQIVQGVLNWVLEHTLQENGHVHIGHSLELNGI